MLMLATGCGTDRPTREDQAETQSDVAVQPEKAGEQSTATAQPARFAAAAESPSPIPPTVDPRPTQAPPAVFLNEDPDPAATVETYELLTDVEQIVKAAHENFFAANSYSAEMTYESFIDHEEWNYKTSLFVGPNHRTMGTEHRGSTTVDILYVLGFSYERPADEPDHPWSEMGRGFPEAVERLRSAVGWLRNADTVTTEVMNGRTVYRVEGAFNPLASAGCCPPPPGARRVQQGFATMVVDAQTLLPISVSTEFTHQVIEEATGNVIFDSRSTTQASISNYGRVRVEAEHPYNLVPTPTPVHPDPPTVTPTATPTATPTPAATATALQPGSVTPTPTPPATTPEFEFSGGRPLFTPVPPTPLEEFVEAIEASAPSDRFEVSEGITVVFEPCGEDSDGTVTAKMYDLGELGEPGARGYMAILQIKLSDGTWSVEYPGRTSHFRLTDVANNPDLMANIVERADLQTRCE